MEIMQYGRSEIKRQVRVCSCKNKNKIKVPCGSEILIKIYGLIDYYLFKYFVLRKFIMRLPKFKYKLIVSIALLLLYAHQTKDYCCMSSVFLIVKLF